MIRSMASSTGDQQTLRGQDLPILGGRILKTLMDATAARLEAERSLAAFLVDAQDPESRRHAEELNRARESRDHGRVEILEKQVAARAAAERRAGRAGTTIDVRERASLDSVSEACEKRLDSIALDHETTTWTADAVYENLEPRPRIDFETARAAIETRSQEIAAVAEQVERLLNRALIRVNRMDESITRGAPDLGNRSCARLEEQFVLARRVLEGVRKESVALIMRNWLSHFALAAVVIAALYVARGLAVGTDFSFNRALFGAAIGLLLLIQIVVWYWAGRRLVGFAAAITTIRATALELQQLALVGAAQLRKEQETVFRRQHRAERSAVDLAAQPKRQEAAARAASRSEEIRAIALRVRRAAVEQGEAALQQVEADASRAFETLHLQYDADLDAEETRHANRLREIAAVHAARNELLRSEWKAARDQIRADTKSVTSIEQQLFPAWAHPSWERFAGQAESIGGARLGTLTIPMHAIPGALPVDPDLAWPAGSPRILNVPIALSFPSNASLLIETGQEGRTAGIALLQETILRILTALPPGRARFTIIDPVGLGEPFAAFMHLTDEAEHVIGERIWTDPRHIEQRLVALCEHMETVIQKFLRNEFEDIDAYNAQAGEIAESYRFLVLADFPTGLSDTAARRLASIVNSGARCGVFTIILRDTRQPVPPEIDIADIRSRSLCVHWNDERLVVSAAPFKDFAFTAGSVPASDAMIALLRRIGTTAKNARRVEVPFAAIAPREEEIWTESASRSISVALGRAGAMRLQAITLGVGTSQHALIAGKTGSGKSTLLHALITNLALRYSPDEAELWLVDFKKGVEFRTYATNQLPHARAVAIESDREFGLSVLRGLDGELRRRGDIFRDRSVQDLGGYRRLGLAEVIPRTLLIIDEFQELFTEDDKVSEESALLLDRLVRQGRAFGIHVILGSQTLGGAYSIARATMGQMAIRIALQCNEADSQLILADDNVAARHLSRPGEAIYNDAGGLAEGNNPFQVVWLPDDERDRLLAKLRDRVAKSPPSNRPPMIVFEGSAAALLEENRLMQRARSMRSKHAAPATPLLWFGDAISIKDPTAVALRRQTGTNIMIVGQREDAALGISAGVLVSLAAQIPAGHCQVHLIDGTPPDAPEFGKLASLHQQLRLGGSCGGLRDCDSILATVAAELVKRQSDHSTLAPTWLVLVHAAHRFRSLRRNEEDFGYGSTSEKAPTADKLLATVARDGPQVGIHVLVTCDGATNLARTFDRNAIREFEWRLLFQVSASDSSTLIDSPIASRLGPQRALLHNEETAIQEKFRPYAWPEPRWIEQFMAAD